MTEISIAVAVITVDSDWGSFQVTSDGASVQPIKGFKYPSNIFWTPTGVTSGQPNKNLQPSKVTINVQVQSHSEKVNFFTAHGNRGKSGPAGGSIVVELDNYDYSNTVISGDGFNFKAINNAPLTGSDAEYD